MCKSYGVNFIKPKSSAIAASLDDYKVNDANLFAKQASVLGSKYLLSIGQGNGRQILGIEEILKTAANGAKSSPIFDSDSSMEDESSFADYEGCSFLTDEDDCSISSNESEESTETSIQWWQDPLLDESEEDLKEFENEIDKVLKSYRDLDTDDERKFSRQGSTDSLRVRHVSFNNHVQVREYSVIVGSHSNGGSVCPMELSWEYVEAEDTIDEEMDGRKEIWSTIDQTQVKIPAKLFHDSFDVDVMNGHRCQRDLKSMLIHTNQFRLNAYKKSKQPGFQRLSVKERRERIAAVQGISIRQVRMIELKSIMEQVNESIHAMELLDP